jgi:hypothetical protein
MVSPIAPCQNEHGCTSTIIIFGNGELERATRTVTNVPQSVFLVANTWPQKLMEALWGSSMLVIGQSPKVYCALHAGHRAGSLAAICDSENMDTTEAIIKRMRARLISQQYVDKGRDWTFGVVAKSV